MTRRGRIRHESVEQRLRDALAARAGSADWGDLRPAAPPTGPQRSFSRPRRTVIALAGLAAAAVACALFAVATHGSDSPARPADRPSHVPGPTVSPVPTPVPEGGLLTEKATTSHTATPSPKVTGSGD